jgi:hypothetical protein
VATCLYHRLHSHPALWAGKVADHISMPERADFAAALSSSTAHATAKSNVCLGHTVRQNPETLQPSRRANRTFSFQMSIERKCMLIVNIIITKYGSVN